MSQPLVMLNYAELKAPPETASPNGTHAGVLVVPAAADCAAAALANRDAAEWFESSLLGVPFSTWRARTRDRLLDRRTDPGRGDRHETAGPVIVLGHQPAGIHPGVWAKHVVAGRLAEALGGVAVNLIVDNDAPVQPSIEVPVLASDRLELRRIRFADVPAGFAYEQLPAQSPGEIDEIEGSIRDALGPRFDRSMAPRFFAAFRDAPTGSDWVDQSTGGRRAVDAEFGVSMQDRRVSRIWWSPLLVDLCLDADRFVAVYNAALNTYRRENGVRGANRPIPDLETTDGRFELPVWAYRRGEPRRRAHVERKGTSIRMLAADQVIFEAEEGSLRESAAGAVPTGEWMLRPRALTLTMWARLMLADLFVHGIGGAKYDRISDGIIRDYYGLTPPAIACVSATLRMNLEPRTSAPPADRLRHELRDIHWNPQRHTDGNAGVAALRDERASAVEQSRTLREQDPGNRTARREVWRQIRDVNRRLREACEGVIERRTAELQQAVRAEHEARIAGGREYWYVMYTRDELQRLADALPPVEAFRV